MRALGGTIIIFSRGFKESGRLELTAGFRVELETRRDSEKFDDLMSSGRHAKARCTIWRETWSLIIFSGGFKESGRLELTAGFRVEISS